MMWDTINFYRETLRILREVESRDWKLEETEYATLLSYAGRVLSLGTDVQKGILLEALGKPISQYPDGKPVYELDAISCDRFCRLYGSFYKALERQGDGVEVLSEGVKRMRV